MSLTYGGFVTVKHDPQHHTLSKSGRRLLTACRFAAASNRSIHTTRDQLLIEMCKYKEREPEYPGSDTWLGKLLEPFCRILYEKMYKVEVKLCDLMIPLWDDAIGGIPDGLVGDRGLLEIKTAREMYHSLKARMILGDAWQGDYSHIPPDHYDQMQGYMAITGRIWCDYFVLGIADRLLYVERIPFDRRYWEEELYPQLKSFMTECSEIG